MASPMNFKNMGNSQHPNSNGMKTREASPIARQSSLYSLTFDELQSVIGGRTGKEFGSMNMDELLKSIWTAEEGQQTGAVSGGDAHAAANPNLARQGSLTLSRTLSQMTVDEVWRDLTKDCSGGANAGLNLPQRQLTLGEITLEEFLVRAGVAQQIRGSNGDEILRELSHIDTSSNNHSNGMMLGYHQASLNSSFAMRNAANGNYSAASPFLASEVKSQPLQRVIPLHQQPLYPKPASSAISNGARLSPVGTIGIPFRGSADIKSPKDSPDVNPKSDGDSPTPCMFNGGRKRAMAMEKVIERRQRRMIKNRESAARSRARKQAYTLELEAEVAKLKEVNQKLQMKQDELMEMHKNQMEMINQSGARRQRLRRTVTGPW